MAEQQTGNSDLADSEWQVGNAYAGIPVPSEVTDEDGGPLWDCAVECSSGEIANVCGHTELVAKVRAEVVARALRGSPTPENYVNLVEHLYSKEDEETWLAAEAIQSLAALHAMREAELSDVWKQAQENHERYSATHSDEGDIRFFGLGLAGEAGEVANFIKKRWRDGAGHEDELRAECADVLAYTMMLAWKLGMTPQSLIAEVARKQQVFIEKMERKALDQRNG